MKWSVQQLEKLTNTPYKFNFTLDFQEEIKKVEDILEERTSRMRKMIHAKQVAISKVWTRL